MRSAPADIAVSIRVLDSRALQCEFAVSCQTHGRLGDGLTLKQAYALQDAHRLEHVRSEALDFPPAS